MLQRKKKGFTLAELLIVVAIIAVLTAIAVPLFTASIKKANDSVEAANLRALRGTAVVKILEENMTLDEGDDCWVATADIDAKGNMTNLNVQSAKKAEADSERKSGDTYTVIIEELFKATE